MITYPLLPRQEQETLLDALYYMKMAELKESCHMLALPTKGKKGELIKRMIIFIQTGKIITVPAIPSASRAKNHPPQPLAKDSLMLHGSYKNDAQTRALFKQLIGSHFHFTAFGIDWLNDRWQKGNPPTYQEFAHYWHEEMKQRTKVKASPKQEWALINFLQKATQSHPTASQAILMAAWKKLRAEKAALAQKIIAKLSATAQPG